MTLDLVCCFKSLTIQQHFSSNIVAGKLGALHNLLSYSKFAWHRIRFVQCPTHSAAYHGHIECLELLLSAGLFEDLQKSMAYAQQQGEMAAYQAINYYITTNDTSVYFSADEGLDSSRESLRVSIGNALGELASATGDISLDASDIVNSSDLSDLVKANGTPPQAPQLNA